jgi:hypothetical protein
MTAPDVRPIRDFFFLHNDIGLIGQVINSLSAGVPTVVPNRSPVVHSLHTLRQQWHPVVPMLSTDAVDSVFDAPSTGVPLFPHDGAPGHAPALAL